MNMGVVAHHLYKKYLSTNCSGTFAIEYYKDSETLKNIHHERQIKHPLLLDEKGLIQKGYLPLTSITKNTQYCALLLIGNC